MTGRDADWAVQQYETVRGLLPPARMPAAPEPVADLGVLADAFDAFLLDAFGVLNVGEAAIAGAPERVTRLRGLGKRVLVLTNGATFPAEKSLEKFRALGFDFDLDDIVSSRDALGLALADRLETGHWGAMAATGSRVETLGVPYRRLGLIRADYDDACGFLMLSTAEWTDEQQALLHDSLKENPRPVLVGNPDIVAPREQGLTIEPGFHAHDLARRLNIRPRFFGKPFSNVYDLAFSRLPGMDPSRVLMVGDTLHTDVLGGAAFGCRTALVTDHGLFSGRDPADFIDGTGIVPDYVLPSI